MSFWYQVWQFRHPGQDSGIHGPGHYFGEIWTSDQADVNMAHMGKVSRTTPELWGHLYGE